MFARTLLLTLVAATAAIASEPFHAWLHAEAGVEWSRHREIHGGACDHQPAHPAHDGCLLCVQAHGTPAVSQHPAPDGDVPTSVATPPDDGSIPRSALARGSLGARGPPVRG